VKDTHTVRVYLGGSFHVGYLDVALTDLERRHVRALAQRPLSLADQVRFDIDVTCDAVEFDVTWRAEAPRIERDAAGGRRYVPGWCDYVATTSAPLEQLRRIKTFEERR